MTDFAEYSVQHLACSDRLRGSTAVPPRIQSADSLAQARFRPRGLKPRLVAKSRLSEPFEPVSRVATPELSIRSISVDLTL